MRIFCASIATETNTFSPLRADLSDFKESFYAAPGEHPETPTLCSAVFPVCRRRAKEEGWELVEGTATWAEPGGIVNAKTWDALREEVLEQLRKALPVDAVILGLHGAMVAQNCQDCEGALLEAIREIVGSDVVIGATLDPHSHLSQKRVANADILVAFKEFPHTDFVECAESCVDLVVRTVRGEISPELHVADCNMIEVLPTSREPMRSFVDKIQELEGQNGILSVSVIHGFMAGDVPDMGTKVLVVAEQEQGHARLLAKDLSQELFSFRGRTRPEFLSPAEAVARAKAAPNGPVVIADVWDNPGGGVPGDSTILLRTLVAQEAFDAAVGTIWDPMAVKTCISAGEDATLKLRFGSKMSDTAGPPIDADVTVLKIVQNATQDFGTSIVPLGDSVAIDYMGITVILNSNRSQSFDPSLFRNLGVDPKSKKILVIKSTNHFYDAFVPVASEILYASVDGPYPNDPRTTDYKFARTDIWPRTEKCVT
ncbi:microcystin LR degradation protein MlrC-like protein [Kiloniella spongiae]|uniref:Microcystinase C n=1 Tax=Kiloniella spongiae TaxID=1489064 RepID=A0A0H2MUK1_9PROT|nr:M81 family metallopeptidase [Kiloniella spongiae]KLN60390.1 microcystin LR degradation protein MlrC-like protein [Kiloniella spongiae]